jgi:hypothetical protein
MKHSRAHYKGTRISRKFRVVVQYLDHYLLSPAAIKLLLSEQVQARTS